MTVGSSPGQWLTASLERSTYWLGFLRAHYLQKFHPDEDGG
jgi:hypothetical protein